MVTVIVIVVLDMERIPRGLPAKYVGSSGWKCCKYTFLRNLMVLVQTIVNCASLL